MSDFKIVTDSIGKDDASNATAVKNAIHFYEKKESIENFEADTITVGNYK